MIGDLKKIDINMNSVVHGSREVKRCTASMVSELIQHPELKFILEDLEKFILPGKFDTVILLKGIEHIESKIPFLQKFKKQILRARLLLRVPMFNRDLRVPLRKELGPPYFLDDTHYTEYTQESFGQVMDAAGMRRANIEIRWNEICVEVVSDA